MDHSIAINGGRIEGKSRHMPTPKLTNEILNAEILGMEAQKDKLDAQIAELRAMLPGGPKPMDATSDAAPHRRRKMSAAGRKAIAQGQRKRWAKIRGESEPLAPAKAPPAKRRISEAGMKRIIAATKKRWRLQRAAAQAQSTPPKKAAPARKTGAVKKAAVKAAPAKAAKKAAVKKSPAKKTATAAVQTTAESASQ